jgi:hypothetical protein
MHDEAITPNHLTALLALKPAAARGFYLAGGTGLCLRLAHRRSIDLDLFRDEPFDPENLLRELEAEGLRFTNASTKPNTLWIEVEGVHISFMLFPYPCIGPAEPGLGVPIATLADIAAMKIEAIASRGARKDFYDLYFICKESGGLKFALDAFEKRFVSAHPDVMHRLKALTFFDDAEKEPEPMLLKPVEWQIVREYFENEVRAAWETP